MQQEDAIIRTAAMYRILDSAGINIIRVGLKSSDIINGKNMQAGTFHPAFRQLVEGKIAQEDLDIQLRGCKPNTSVCCVSHPDSFNNMIGHKAVNNESISAVLTLIFRISYKADRKHEERHLFNKILKGDSK